MRKTSLNANFSIIYTSYCCNISRKFLLINHNGGKKRKKDSQRKPKNSRFR